ncbi:MAG: archease [Candidatus Aminicenantes bacterium]|nr:archease [Candidatus Aminicenantes bacterium]
MSTKRRTKLTFPAEHKDYTFFAHTADAKFRAYGATLEEAFRNAAYALVSLMWDRQTIEKKIERSVEIKSRDDKQLLVGFLEEILYLLDSRSFLLHSVEDLNIRYGGSGYSLRGYFWGDSYKESYSTYGDVKAVTYNEMAIVQEDCYMVQVVVDV